MKKNNAAPIIHIIGLPGAGKTTPVRRLSRALKEINLVRKFINYASKKSTSVPSDDRTLQWLGMALELLRKISEWE